MQRKFITNSSPPLTMDVSFAAKMNNHHRTLNCTWPQRLEFQLENSPAPGNAGKLGKIAHVRFWKRGFPFLLYWYTQLGRRNVEIPYSNYTHQICNFVSLGSQLKKNISFIFSIVAYSDRATWGKSNVTIEKALHIFC